MLHRTCEDLMQLVRDNPAHGSPHHAVLQPKVVPDLVATHFTEGENMIIGNIR